MKKIHLITMVLTMGLISATGPGEDLTFSDWDKNGDNLISKNEFKQVFKANYVNDLDVVDDAQLDDEDFYLMTYRIWDGNNDEMMTKEEWLMGYDYNYGDYLVDDFVAYDVDGDGLIEYAEFRDAIMETDYYIVWDLDDNDHLSEDEIAEALFNNWDADDSSFIEMGEYNMFDAYYLDF